MNRYKVAVFLAEGARYKNIEAGIVGVQVEATSEQEAINKALRETESELWYSVENLDACQAQHPTKDLFCSIGVSWHDGAHNFTRKPQKSEPHAGPVEIQEPEPVNLSTLTDPGTWKLPENGTKVRIIDVDGLMAGAQKAQQSAFDRVLQQQIDRLYEKTPQWPAAFGGLSGPEIWETAWEPVKGEDEELTLKNIIGQAIGTGSMCWSQTPQGLFDSERAQWVVGGAVNQIEKLIYEQTGYATDGQKAGELYPETIEMLMAQFRNDTTGLQEVVTRSFNAGYETHMSDAAGKVYDEDTQPECGVAAETEESKQHRIQRDADKAAVIELILSYRNTASEEEKLRQIRVVMD